MSTPIIPMNLEACERLIQEAKRQGNIPEMLKWMVYKCQMWDDRAERMSEVPK